MLAGDFIDAALDRLSETEIVPAEGQNLRAQDDLEHPVREPNLNLRHAAGRGGANNAETVDQPKAVGDFLAVGLDVGRDPGTAQALKSLDHAAVAVAAGLTVGPDEQIVRLQLHRL